MKINLPETGQKRVVIIGGGFAGLTLARKLIKSDFQIILIDKNNFHQFQPLFYQVAMAGLEPSSISFPFRKLFQYAKNVYIRVCEVKKIWPERNQIETTFGIANYDYLVIAIGADTNFFGNAALAQKTIPMKSVSEALYLRNRILSDYEEALTITDYETRQTYLDIVIVGGGPTGVEVAGALSEMKQFIIPKDYHEINKSEIDIYLIQGGPVLLPGMSKSASEKAFKFLEHLDVKILLDTRVVGFDGQKVQLQDGSSISAKKVIWAAGIQGNKIEGLPENVIYRGNRIKVNRFNQVEGFGNIFALGDIAFMQEEKYPEGHPQVAQVAIQQAKHMAANLKSMVKGKAMQPFTYKDLGSMATIGRNKAVVDLPFIKFQGALAWFVWLFVHLFQILGVKNKLFVFINWVSNYFSYDQSLRLIIKPKVKSSEDNANEQN